MSKLALCVGINYINTPYQLSGCASDAKHFSDHLKKQNFEVVMLCDDSKESNGMPTKLNIIQNLLSMVDNANSVPGSHIVFTYSGHGSSVRDRNLDEIDGFDELIVCIDNKAIIDDDLYEIFVSKLNSDVKVFCVFDSCHSGSMLDLEYRYSKSDNIIENKNLHTEADIVCISGCRDSETSADAYIGLADIKYAGALTYCFFKEYSPEKSIKKLIEDIRKILKSSGYSQYPELTMTKEKSIDDKIGNYF